MEAPNSGANTDDDNRELVAARKQKRAYVNERKARDQKSINGENYEVVQEEGKTEPVHIHNDTENRHGVATEEVGKNVGYEDNDAYYNF
ncbi:conserved hypothetical protein [Ricinus communis]|uniref:Uncharacterized protein n=1 Tax=Ricinus communis TaxID=3988 RepID=B9SFS8_RICCO|nr:conserved hypothetical protein [Ricinus communis]